MTKLRWISAPIKFIKILQHKFAGASISTLFRYREMLLVFPKCNRKVIYPATAEQNAPHSPILDRSTSGLILVEKKYPNFLEYQRAFIVYDRVNGKINVYSELSVITR